MQVQALPILLLRESMQVQMLPMRLLQVQALPMQLYVDFEWRRHCRHAGTANVGTADAADLASAMIFKSARAPKMPQIAPEASGGLWNRLCPGGHYLELNFTIDSANTDFLKSMLSP